MAGMRLLLVLSSLVLLLGACRKEPLPDPVRLSLPLAVDGTPFSIHQHRGHATLVFFFSTWCVPCQAMEPFVAAAARQGKGEGIEVIGIALDREGQKTVAPYVLVTEPPYPVLIGGGAIAEGRSAFGRIPELPAVIFLDGEGRPAAVLTGVANTELLLDRAREVRGRTR